MLLLHVDIRVMIHQLSFVIAILRSAFGIHIHTQLFLYQSMIYSQTLQFYLHFTETTWAATHKTISQRAVVKEAETMWQLLRLGSF